MNTAFIGIDFINGITNASFPSAACAPMVAANKIIPNTNRAMQLCKNAGVLVILVNLGFDGSLLDAPLHSPIFGNIRQQPKFILNTADCDLHPQLQGSLASTILTKPRVSAFYNTRLQAVLQASSIQRLIICGVSTALTVQSTVRQAHDMDYEVIVLADCCAAANEQEHESSLGILSRMAKIINVSDLDKELPK